MYCLPVGFSQPTFGNDCFREHPNLMKYNKIGILIEILEKKEISIKLLTNFFFHIISSFVFFSFINFKLLSILITILFLEDQLLFYTLQMKLVLIDELPKL